MARIHYNCLNGEVYKTFLQDALKRSDGVVITVCWPKDKFSYVQQHSLVDDGIWTEIEYLNYKNIAQQNWKQDKALFEKYTIPFLKKLEPFLKDDLFFDKNKTTYCLEACVEINDILLETGGINNWGSQLFPDDLCFINNGKYWFISENHEHTANLYPDDESDFKFWEKIGVIFLDKFSYQNDVKERPLFCQKA